MATEALKRWDGGPTVGEGSGEWACPSPVIGVQRCRPPPKKNGGYSCKSVQFGAFWGKNVHFKQSLVNCLKLTSDCTT